MKPYKGKLRLYVKSVRTVVGRLNINPPRLPGRLLAADQLYPTIRYEYVLPEDQQAVTEIVRVAARKHFLELQVIDVAREDALHKFLQEEIKKLKRFPTLITDSGDRIEGDMSERQVNQFLQRAERISSRF